MARKRIENSQALKSWDDVNLALTEIMEHEISKEQIEADMQKTIADTKLQAENAAKPHMEAIKRQEVLIKTFVEAHKADMGNKKTMVLNNGEVGYRKSTKAKLPQARTLLDEIIAKLRALKMTDCIKTKPETIDKEAVKKYPAEKLAAIGIILETKDTIGYKLYRDTLKPET